MLPSTHRLKAGPRDLDFYEGEPPPKKKTVRYIDDGLGGDEFGDEFYIGRSEKRRNTPNRKVDVEAEPGWCWLCYLLCCAE